MRFGLIAIALGGAVVIALVGWAGAQSIGRDVLAAKWVIPLTILLHLLQLYLSGVAWRRVSAADAPSRLEFFRIRWIREAVNALLPVAQLGGNLVGIRLLVLRGLPANQATAGNILDIAVEALTQLLFSLTAVAVLARLDADRSWAPWLGAVVAVMAVCVVVLLVGLRVGAMRLLEAGVNRLARILPSLPLTSLRGLHDELMRLQGDRWMLLWVNVLHLAALFVGIGETWLILHAVGVPVGVGAALVIESLGLAARSAGFAVPGALGVQEAGFILVCGLFGISADAAIAVSMLKRVRELVVGLPGLAAWQWSEGRHLLRRTRVTERERADRARDVEIGAE